MIRAISGQISVQQGCKWDRRQHT